TPVLERLELVKRKCADGLQFPEYRQSVVFVLRFPVNTAALTCGACVVNPLLFRAFQLALPCVQRFGASNLFLPFGVSNKASVFVRLRNAMQQFLYGVVESFLDCPIVDGAAADIHFFLHLIAFDDQAAVPCAGIQAESSAAFSIILQSKIEVRNPTNREQKSTIAALLSKPEPRCRH